MEVYTMLRFMKAEIKRCLRAPNFYLAIALCLSIYLIGEGYLGWINIILYPSTTWVQEHNGFMMEFNPFRTLLPFPAALAAGNILIEDWEHHNCYFQTTRCSFKAFCHVKFFVPCLLGGFVLAFGCLCYLGTMSTFVPAYDDSTYYEPFIEPLLHNEQWGLYFLYFSSLQFLLGALCAGIGAITATMTTRKGMVYLMPMLLFAMLEIVTNITIVGLSGAQSSIVFRLNTTSPVLVYCVIASILIVLLAISYFSFFALLRKRVFVWQ